jgi:ribosomal protein S2
MQSKFLYSITDFINRFSYIGLASNNSYNKISTAFILGKRNGFFLINFDLSFFLLRKSLNFISQIFYYNLTAQSLVYTPFISESNRLKKNYIRYSSIKVKKKATRNKLRSNLKVNNDIILFTFQTFIAGKWDCGTLTNWFKSFNVAYDRFFIKCQLYDREVKFRKDVIRSRLRKTGQQIISGKFRFNSRYAKNFYKTALKNRKFTFKSIFFKKDNYFLLDHKLPSFVIVLKQQLDVINECHIVDLPNIAILDPIQINEKIDYPIYSNRTKAIAMLSLKLFRSSIFLGRLLKLKKLLTLTVQKKYIQKISSKNSKKKIKNKNLVKLLNI